jgi:hypothetical protein
MAERRRYRQERSRRIRGHPESSSANTILGRSERSQRQTWRRSTPARAMAATPRARRRLRNSAQTVAAHGLNSRTCSARARLGRVFPITLVSWCSSRQRREPNVRGSAVGAVHLAVPVADGVRSFNVSSLLGTLVRVEVPKRKVPLYQAVAATAANAGEERRSGDAPWRPRPSAPSCGRMVKAHP